MNLTKVTQVSHNITGIPSLTVGIDFCTLDMQHLWNTSIKCLNKKYTDYIEA